MDLTKLIREGIRGDQKSLGKLYEMNAPYVYSIVKVYIHDRYYHKDVMQEVFIEIFKSLKRFDERKGAFKTWLRRITINTSIKFIKSNARLKLVFEEESKLVILKDQTEHFEFKDSQSLKDLLKHMPPGYKTVLLLYYIDDYKHKEISQMLNISVQTSRSQLSRALKWLKKNLPPQTQRQYFS